MSPKKDLSYYYFLTLLLTNFVLVTLAIIFYRDRFDFWWYPFSSAGDALTQSGFPNTLSSRIYGLDMILTGIIMLGLAIMYWRMRPKLLSLQAIIAFLGGSGALIAALNPDDLSHSLHVLGSALLFAALWLLATNYISLASAKLGKVRSFLLQLILQLPIFVYAATYFLNIDPASYILQKIAIAGLVITLLYTPKPAGKDKI